jgi:multiple sugar transport system ATP-binding protein
MAEIRVERVSKVFPGGNVAVNDLSLTVGDGEFLVLVGPSGCGKSTLLRIIAGLEEPTVGRIFVGDTEITDLEPKRRDFAMVFQNYALYPHMTVEKNLGFGLKLRRVSAGERRKRVAETSRILGLENLLDRKPGQLSGGQRQRVAMGRAIVREPQAFLMDEPLSNLDARLRVSMRSELARLHERLRTTTVYVTHDQVEAMTLGHRVAVMKDGVIQQIDTPSNLFVRPANFFVASFIGSPAMNFVRARVADGAISFADFSLPLPNVHGVEQQTGREVILGVRPSFFEDDAFASRDLPRLEVRVEVVEELGTETLVVFQVAAPRVTEIEGAGGDDDEERLVQGDYALFTARVDARSRIRPGDTARLAVDNARIHFFDPVTGDAIEPLAPPDATVEQQLSSSLQHEP